MSRTEAYTQAIAAYNDAYGRTQSTPDGAMCWMGRIDRAYNIAAANANEDRYMNAVQTLINQAVAAFTKADTAAAQYLRLCKKERKAAEAIIVDCDCPYCQRRPLCN